MPATPVSDLYQDLALAEFYDLAPRPRPDFAYCTTLAANARSVLDLGCGTGALAVALSAHCQVTAVDPAAAMLRLAQTRADAEAVTWVQADATTLRLGRRFDLIVLTGHSFQVFLTRAAQRAVLATIAAYLAPAGRFVFDTRNPAFPGAKERTRAETEHQITHPVHGPVDAWNVSHYDPASGILSFSNSYRITATGETRSASARILYTPREVLEGLIREAGLGVEHWLGDWSGAAFAPRSREIIPVGRLA